MTISDWSHWCEHIPLPQLWPCAVGCSSGSPPQINLRMCRWLPRWTVSVIRSADGVSAILRTVSPACKMRRARVGRGAFPPSERVDVLSIATKKPATYHCPATRWSLDDLVAALSQHRLRPMSRSSLWRILEEADLKPHRSVYWLNSHEPDCDANFTTRAPYPTGATGQTGKTRARVHPPWGTRAPGLLRRTDGPTRVASWADPHQCGLGRPSHTRRAATACDAAL